MPKNLIVFGFELIFFASVSVAEDFKAIDGKEYKNVTVSRVEPDGIVLTSSSGISKVYFTELPKEVQERFLHDQAPRLAPEATYFLTGSTSVVKDGALIGLHAGTVVTMLRDDGSTFHVKWGDTELDVDKKIVTNDPTVAAAAVANDQRAQAALGEWMDAQRNPSSKGPNQQESADASQQISDLFLRALTGNTRPDDEALAERLKNTPQAQEIRENIKSMDTEGRRMERARANIDRIESERAQNARQASASANYEAKEKARMITLDQRKALSAEIQHLESEKQLIEKNNQSTYNISREIDTKQKVLNSLGGQF